MKRRAFIRNTSAGLLASMLMPKNMLADWPGKSEIGLQLYSLREPIQGDLAGTLKKIADIGYTNLEAAGYSDGKFYGVEPEDFKTMVEDLGMKLLSSHVTFDKNQVGQVLEAHSKAKIKYMVWPWLSKEQRVSEDSYMEVSEKFNVIGKMCKDNGMSFGYHNHDFEFSPFDNGTVPYDILLDSTDPDLVFMQIDLYWTRYAGIDPIGYFEKYPGRFHLWHIKDMKAGDSKEMTEVGSGIIDYKKLFQYCSLAGMKSYFIEQDTIKGDPFLSIKDSFDYANNNL